MGTRTDWSRQRFYDMLGQKLHRARDRGGLTQRELASKVGISISVVANAESGHNAPMHYVRSVALALGVTIDSLMPEDA